MHGIFSSFPPATHLPMHTVHTSIRYDNSVRRDLFATSVTETIEPHTARASHWIEKRAETHGFGKLSCLLFPSKRAE